VKTTTLSSASLFLILATTQTVLAFSGSGSGTEPDPYIVTNIDQFQETNNDRNAWYKLGNDIEASITCEWNGGTGFVPIGDNSNAFLGCFDGNEHIIIGLFIKKNAIDCIGVFGKTGQGSEIKNIGFADADITGNNYTGGIVGYNYEGTITNSYLKGSISGKDNVGGLVGYNRGAITQSYFIGNVCNDHSSGGLVGQNYQGTIDTSFSVGNVNGDNYVGGLVGWNSNGITTITNSFSTTKVKGDEYVGGLVGLNYVSISNSYSTGSVEGEEYLGGLIGYSSGGICNNCFWDTETSGQDVSQGGSGKTTEEMMQQITFDPPWDFNNVWDIKEGKTCPFLRDLSVCGGPWHPYPTGDLNYDCRVNLLDFNIFVSHWLECNSPECD